MSSFWSTLFYSPKRAWGALGKSLGQECVEMMREAAAERADPEEVAVATVKFAASCVHEYRSNSIGVKELYAVLKAMGKTMENEGGMTEKEVMGFLSKVMDQSKVK